MKYSPVIGIMYMLQYLFQPLCVSMLIMSNAMFVFIFLLETSEVDKPNEKAAIGYTILLIRKPTKDVCK